VCGEQLAAKTPLGRVELTVYVCGRQCIADFNKNPRDTIVRWADTFTANAKAVESRGTLSR
jgi:hypothetical protein